MRNQSNYSLEFRTMIVEEYEKGEGGYKKLGKRHEITRDLVRRWVQTSRHKCRQERHLEMSKKTKFKSLEEEVEYLRDAHMFWKTYAKLLGKKKPGNKKKDIKLTQSKDVQNREQK